MVKKSTADQPEAKQPKPKRRKKRGAGAMNLILAGVAFLVTLVPFFYIYLTALIMMAPTVVARLVDGSHRRLLFQSIMAVNLCGALPAFGHLAGDFLSYDRFIAVITDVSNWLAAYGAAGFGYAVYNYVPKIVARGMAARAKAGIRVLIQGQRALIQEWGPVVAEKAGFLPREDEDDDSFDFASLRNPDRENLDMGGAGMAEGASIIPDLAPNPDGGQNLSSARS